METVTTPVFLSGKSHGQRNLVGYSPQDHKESDSNSKVYILLVGVFQSRLCGLPRWLSGKRIPLMQEIGYTNFWILNYIKICIYNVKGNYKFEKADTYHKTQNQEIFSVHSLKHLYTIFLRILSVYSDFLFIWQEASVLFQR